MGDSFQEQRQKDTTCQCWLFLANYIINAMRNSQKTTLYLISDVVLKRYNSFLKIFNLCCQVEDTNEAPTWATLSLYLYADAHAVSVSAYQIF